MNTDSTPAASNDRGTQNNNNDDDDIILTQRDGAAPPFAVGCPWCGTVPSPWSCCCGTTRSDYPMSWWADQYARRGWQVFPLDGKTPLTRHGHRDATTDRQQVARWWQRWPHANIGAPVPPDVLVLDVDPRNGGTVDELPALPLTLTCWSGRDDGGRHLYYRMSVHFTLDRKRAPSGVDVNTNGFMVVPPSLHPSTGLPYWWLNMPAVELPSSLRERLTRRTSSTPTRASLSEGDPRRRMRGLYDKVRTTSESERNKVLFWASCRAAELVATGDVDEPTAAAILSDAARLSGLDGREIDTTIASGMRIGGAK